MQSRLALPEELGRFIQPFRVVGEMILVVLLALTVARLVWLVIAPQAAVASLEPRSLPGLNTSTTAQITSADRTVLVQLNPFATGTVAEIPDAPETQLNLRLIGLFMSTDAFGGTAQITTPNNQTSRYAINDEILPGVSLERVLSDRVILRRNGETETLMKNGRDGGLSVIGDGSQVTAQPGGAVSAEDASRPAPGSVPQAAPETEFTIADPDVLFRVVAPTPVERGNGLYGYALTPRGSSAALGEFGLASGDILLQINGTSVSELNVNEIANEIGNNRVAVLTVERGGNMQTVRLVFDE